VVRGQGGYGVGWGIVGTGKRVRNDGPGGGEPLYTLSEILNASDELLEIVTYGGKNARTNCPLQLLKPEKHNYQR
jgi:hypothetical protein